LFTASTISRLERGLVRPGLEQLLALAEPRFRACLEEVHELKDYHGDLHGKNIIVARRGIHFEVHLIDFYRWYGPTSQNIREDVRDIIRIYYDSIGGRAHYVRQPQVVKNICCGLKKSLIHRRFPTAGRLRRYLETMEWSE
jgi:tRNA A-37 threonylcarbamoyl transferase component Bud32